MIARWKRYRKLRREWPTVLPLILWKAAAQPPLTPNGHRWT